MTGYVYFFQEKEGLVKIGATKDVESRFKTLRTACPNGLTNIGVIKAENPFKLEKRLHERFKNHRKHGEWFEISGLQAEMIIEAHNKGFHKHDAHSIYNSLTKLKEISELMANSPTTKQNPSEFYDYEILDLFDDSLEIYGRRAKTYNDQLFHMNSKVVSNKLFLLLNSNVWGEFEVNMQQTAKDILTFIEIFQSYISIKPDYNAAAVF